MSGSAEMQEQVLCETGRYVSECRGSKETPLPGSQGRLEAVSRLVLEDGQALSKCSV